MKLTKRQLASRVNGRLSRGPKPRNANAKPPSTASAHGILSNIVLLPGESQEAFETLLDKYVDRLSPTDGAEFTCVGELAATAWRLKRVWAVEKRPWSDAMENHPETDNIGSIAHAFQDLACGPEVALRYRDEARLNNAHKRALNTFFLRGEPITRRTHRLITRVKSKSHAASAPRTASPRSAAAPEPASAALAISPRRRNPVRTRAPTPRSRTVPATILSLQPQNYPNHMPQPNLPACDTEL